MLITSDFVMRHKPCDGYPRERVAALLGSGKTLVECLRSDAVPAKDRLWLATREGACSERVHRLFACWCAEQVLPLFERAHPDDDRPRIAIQVATAYAMGDATDEELAAARDAARAADGACAASAWSAAMDAAYDAACAASAWSAARAAAWAAAWAAYMDASDAAWSAASAAAWAAARAARDAASAAAWAAAWDAAWAAQVAAFIELLETHGG